MTAERERRLLMILELIGSRPIHTQEELAQALTERGWSVTQSSVSRDIARLRLAKVDGAYRRPPSESPSANPDERRVAEGVLRAEPSGDAIIVLHTPSGDANHVAVALDRLAWPGVVGTLAGDNAIFMAVKDSAAQRTILRRVRRLVTA